MIVATICLKDLSFLTLSTYCFETLDHFLSYSIRNRELPLKVQAKDLGGIQ